MNYLPLLLSLSTLGNPTSLNTSCVSNLVTPLVGENAAVFSIRVSENTNSFQAIAIVLFDENSARTQPIWQTSRLGSLASALIHQCGYTGVEFYASPFEGGVPLPTDNFLLPGAFRVNPNGDIQEDRICVNQGAIDDYFYCN